VYNVLSRTCVHVLVLLSCVTFLVLRAICCCCSKVYFVLQWDESSERQILLRNMDFEASGTYSCEVSMQTPIYTKPSSEHELTVIRKCVSHAAR
jgi:hypothetical protein